MKQRRKTPLRLGRSVIIGLRIGVMLLAIAATVTLAVIGFQTYKARTGSLGGEILILPTYAILFYAGWTAHQDTEEYRRSKRREERIHAARSRSGKIAAPGSKS